MALFTPSESPAVVVREIDLTGGVPNVQSTTGAIVGKFRWGPINERVPVANEAELVDNFASPNEDTNKDFLSASQYLRYSNSLQVVRVHNSDDQAQTAVVLSNNDSLGSVTGLDNPLILNKTDFEARETSLISAKDSDNAENYEWAGRFAGELGNSLKVSYLGMLDSTDTQGLHFSNWQYASSFDARPSTSPFAASKNAAADEIHVVVVDEDGAFTGTRGTILETFPSLSVLKDAKNDEGQSIFVKEVINQQSEYVYMINFDSAMDAKGAGDNVVTGVDYALDSGPAVERSFLNGGDGDALALASYQTGFDLFEDKDQVEVDFLISPSLATSTNQVTMVNDLVSTAGSTRKDCLVVASPARDDVIGVTSDATKVTNSINTAASFTKSSYLVVDNNFLKVYDKYNDKYVEIPAASTVAGIMAATDYNRAAWFSPAGARRGQLLGVTSINYSPTKAQRDSLYKAGINPIANIPGQGTILFGDKTFLGRPSAFDRINVRRLFLVLERAIARAAEQVLFEFNDEFTRAEFVNIVEPVLREIKGRRGITDFRVVADETNNTPAVIDRNEFIASIFIKPARSINYVTLNFVAVRTGVDFEEVVGTV